MKRIALGLFMGGMAVCAANAVEVRAVASKGYVDSIAGSLSLLSTQNKTSLVAAINELFTGFDAFELLSNKTQTIDANSTDVQYPSARAVYGAAVAPLADKEDKSNKTQTINANSTIVQYPSAKAVYDAAVAPLANKEDKSNKTQTIDANSTDVQYPSAAAVYDAIQDVTYQDGFDINIDDDNKVNATYASLNYTTAGTGPTEGLEIGNAYISRLDQVNGKVQVTQQPWTSIFSPTADGGGTITDISSLSGMDGNIPVPARDIVGALMLLRGEIPSLDGVEMTSNMTQTVNASSTATQYPSAAAVHTAVNAKQDKSTADYQVGKADGTWQTLTADEIAALQSGVTSGTVEQVATNTTALDERVKLFQGEENKHKVMVTNELGKVIPAPLEVCTDEASKCVLTFGVRTDGTVGFEWEVIAR